MRQPNNLAVNLGCDPEFFFKKGRSIIGAEKVLPKEGLSTAGNKSDAWPGKIIIDGVQGELNPVPYTCRANLANNLKNSLRELQDCINKKDPAVKVVFDQTVKVTKKELESLEPTNKVFGCDPSFNIYDPGSNPLADVDATKVLTRSAGGHIHLGTYGDNETLRKIHADPIPFVTLLDIIVGNTCVLVDRNPANVARRKLYGRAGEYRLPAHGLEYRTLSNFWLHNYVLMSMAFGLARLAAQMAFSDYRNNNKYFFEQFTSVVSLEDIRTAIDTNDFDLAYKNFKAIEPLICSAYPNSTDSQPFGANVMPHFHEFVTKINEKGLTYWFKEDPMTHWLNLPEAHSGGFYDFIMGRYKFAGIWNKK